MKGIKRIARIFIPASIREFIYRSIPRFHKVNTYMLTREGQIKTLVPLNEKFFIREVNKEDIEELRKHESYRNPKAFEKKIIPRLNSPAWHGLAVIDRETRDIAYLAWVIDKTIPYLQEFGIFLKPNEFLLKDGFCVPHYRHQGLHSRMEQERINYCVGRGATAMYIQIHNPNKKGIKSVLDNGYRLVQQNIVIHWPIFNTYRALKGFLKKPFKHIVK